MQPGFDGRVVGGLFFRIVEGIFKHCSLGRMRIDEGQAAEKQRHVDLGAMQQVERLFDERSIVVAPGR